jgi:HAD superfamily phosphoserine phosphatase-like hydrolase
VIVFVDFDGTITDVDTFDLLVRAAAGDEAWNAIDGDLIAGRMTLRDALAAQAALIRSTKAEAFAYLCANVRVDPTFAPFVVRARREGADVRVVSAGIGSLVRATLERHAIDVPVLANDVDFHPDGWRMTFVDDSSNGHDKAVHVEHARAAGIATVFVGDGISDFGGALAADRRFAKKGRALEAYCRERGLACTAFTAFDEVERALFG